MAYNIDDLAAMLKMYAACSSRKVAAKLDVSEGVVRKYARVRRR